MEAFETYQTPLSRCVSCVISSSCCWGWVDSLSNSLSFILCGMLSRYASKEMAHLFSPAVGSLSNSLQIS